MFFRLFLLFTLIPLIELFVLIWLGRRMGLWATIALVILTGALGAALARSQGLRTFERARTDWLEGRIPTEALLDGLLILVAGAVLLTPGLLTDLFGFFLLVPAGRHVVRDAAARWFKRHARQSGQVIVIERRGSDPPP